MNIPGPVRTWLPTLVGAVLVLGIGALLLWLTAPHVPRPADLEGTAETAATGTLSPRGKMVGTSALSHGGPAPSAPTSPAALPSAGASFAVGQQVVVMSPVTGPSPPGESTIVFVPGPDTAATPDRRDDSPVPPGTTGTIMAVRKEPQPAAGEGKPSGTLYRIRLADGRTGWLPGSTLRARPPGGGSSGK